MHKRVPPSDRNAEKQRRYRQRLARHEAVIPVRIGPRGIDLLIKLNWLNEHDSHKRKLIGEAVARMLAEAEQHLPQVFSITRNARGLQSVSSWPCPKLGGPP